MSPGRIAGRLAQRAEALATAGRTDDAIAALTSAVASWRQSAPRGARLADALDRLSALWLLAGQPEQALLTAAEAGDLRRDRLLRRDADGVLALSVGLIREAQALSAGGRHRQALEVLAEAERWLRRIGDAAPGLDTFVELHLGVVLSERVRESILGGDRELAREAVTAAIERARALASEAPGVYVERLARTLDVMSGRLWELGLPEQSLSTMRECVAIRRGLPGVDTGVGTAWSLHHLAERLVAVGRTEEALQTLEEAIVLLTPLVETVPELRPDLDDMVADRARWRAQNSGGTESRVTRGQPGDRGPGG